MWIYKNIEIDDISKMPIDISKNIFGFVYEITHVPSGRKYIGKKVLYFNKKLPALKGQKKSRAVVKESNWLKYYGSNDTIKNLIKDGKILEFKREILTFAYSKYELTYLETKYQFLKEVLEDDNYLNNNILGKFYKGKI
jgi:hypothetical protein